IVLRVADTYDYSYKPCRDQPLKTASEEDKAEYKKHNDVACLMLRKMSHALQKQFESYPPQLMLAELKKMFEKPQAVQIYDLVDALHNCKQASGKSVRAHVLEMKGYMDQLHALEKSYDNDMKAIKYHEWLLQQEAQPRWTRTSIFRDREDAKRRLRADYFDDHYKYPLYYFRRRFRMSRNLFLRIVNDILSYTANPLPQNFYFFTSQLDCTGRMSISALMKCTDAIRQFAYGSTADAFDEYFQMSEHTARDALFFFNMCIIELYMPKYLRKSTSEDVVNIQQKHNNVHCFSGMLGSIDCMHWEWKNCPVAWQGQYGRAGANNDINVLDNSSLFDYLLDDLALAVPYVVNGVGYRNGYYLADGIYPEWASFVKSFTAATDSKHTYFKQHQESARKDVERAFGVLQGHWGLI
nr:hypothetical protein [Tanacetum cinerariifolium]